jgi:molybdopterin-guanine dinucleotide biosynthesis protein
MSSLIRAPSMLAAAAIVLLSIDCRPKVTSVECEKLLARYARLVVTEGYPDASADRVSLEEQREQREARGDDAFKNCSSEVSQAEFNCAMRAETADALEKCLE